MSVPAPPREAVLAVPGDLAAPTGGYEYARRMIAAAPEAGWRLSPLALPAGFPSPSAAEVETALAALEGTRGPVLVDGLAYGALPAERLSAGLRARLAALCHHPLGLETGLSAAESRRLLAQEAEALAAAAGVIATSRDTARLLTERLGVAPARIAVAAPGFDRAPRAPRRGDPPLILGAGTLTRRKGWDLLVEALAPLRDRPWRAVIAGAADREPETAGSLRARISALGLSERVTLAGALPRAELDALYLQADLFCLPSRYEGYGMVIAEAMMRGLPVVSTAAGAIPEAAAGAARLVAPEDAGALSAALAELLADSGARDRLSAAALERAAALPDWPAAAERLGAALSGLLAGGGGR